VKPTARTVYETWTPQECADALRKLQDAIRARSITAFIRALDIPDSVVEDMTYADLRDAALIRTSLLRAGAEETP
jgi:hypothetical protein